MHEEKDDCRVASYSMSEIARALGISRQQARAWAQLVRPDGRHGLYDFRDLVAFRTLKALKDAGLDRGRIAAAIRHLRKSFPSVAAPLVGLRLRVEGREVVVELGDRSMTASGQLLLDLDSGEPRTTVVALPGLDDRVEQGRALGAELAGAHTDLAEQMLAAGRAAEAEAELERALLYDGDHARAYQRLAEAYASLGCPVKAREFGRLAREKGWEGE